MSVRFDPEAITAATQAMCRELYGDNFDLHDHGAQDPEGRGSLERAAEAAVEAFLEKGGDTTVIDSRQERPDVIQTAIRAAINEGIVDASWELSGSDLDNATAAVLAALREHGCVIGGGRG